MNDASAVRRRRLRTGLSYGILVAIAVVFLFPFVIAVVTSFKTEPDATANPLTLIPSPVHDGGVPRSSSRIRTSCSG